jgi:hypothetical protein
MFGVGFCVGLKDSEEKYDFTTSLDDVLFFNDDEIFAYFFGAVGRLDVNDEGR